MNRFLYTTAARALLAADGVASGAAAGGEGGGTGAPAVPATPAAAPLAAPSGDAAPAPAPAPSAVDAAPAPAAPAPSESPPSLLEGAIGKPKTDGAAEAKPSDLKPAELAPAEVKPPEPAKDAAKAKDEAPAPAETAPAETQPPAPLKYEPFKAPEGVTFGDKELRAFTDIVGTAQVPQEAAQKLLDLYLTERTALETQVASEQRDVWNRFNDTNLSQLRNDPELGGNRLDTSLSIAKAVVEEFGGSPEQQAEYWAHLKNNGMGNYLGHVRMLHNIGKKLNVFEDFIVTPQPVNPNPGKSRADRLYGPPKGNGAAP